MAIIAIFILIGLACDAFAQRAKVEVVQIVIEDRITGKPAMLAASPEYLAMKKVIAEAEQNAGKRSTED